MFEVVANALYYPLARRAAQRAIIGLTLVSLVVLAGYAALRGNVDAGSNWPWAIFALARVGFSFFAGVLVYQLAFAGRHHKPLKGWVGLAIAAALLAVFSFQPATWAVTLRDVVCVSVVFPLLIYLGARVHVTGISARLARFSGEVSYPAYVLHLPLFVIGSTIFVRVTKTDVAAHGKVFMVAATLILIAVAYGCGEFLDKPVRRWLTNVRRQMRQSGASPLVTDRSASDKNVFGDVGR